MRKYLFVAFSMALAAVALGASGTAGAAESCAKPMVKTLLVGGAVKPGNAIIIGGCGFGASLGHVQLLGQFPGGKVQLNVDSWSDTGIGVFVPTDVTGAPDQTAKVQVIAKGGAKSNSDRTVTFEAKRERKMVSVTDTEFKCTNHNTAGSEQTCKTGGQTYGSAPCSNTICLQFKGHPVLNDAVHYSRTDDFVLHLKNGHVFDKIEFWGNSGADFAIPYTPPVGPKPAVSVLKKGDEPKVRVKWEAFRPTGWIEYKLKIFVEGPAGVPY